jgi:hypothetical protein
VGDNQASPVLEPEQERKLAASLFNEVWRLMDLPERTEAEDAVMLHGAHASCYHWMQAGEPVNRARGEWQVSRVYSVLGRPEAAYLHAQKVLDICQREGIGDFDLAFAYEALARASALGGDAEAARSWAAQAREASQAITDAEDRDLVLADLATIPSAG